MKVTEPFMQYVAVADTVATALGKLDSNINAADVVVTVNNPIPELSDTPLGYDHVKIGFIKPVANRFAGELQRALKQLTGGAVTKSWTGDAVLYHGPLKDLLSITPEILYTQLTKTPDPYRAH